MRPGRLERNAKRRVGMNPLLGLAFRALPDLIRLVAGDRSGAVEESVIKKVKEVAEEQNEDKAAKKIETDPKRKADLQKQLADMAFELEREKQKTEEAERNAEMELLQARFEEDEKIRNAEFKRLEKDLADRGEARKFYQTLTEQGGLYAWVNPALSLIICVGFIALVYLLLLGGPYETIGENNPGQPTQPNPYRDVFYIALGALATAFATVVGFHFGSSSGSKQKDNVLAAKEMERHDREPVSKRLPKPPEQKKLPPPEEPESEPDDVLDVTDIEESNNFREKAPSIMRLLIQDFSVSPAQAAGILGNIGHECAGFQKMQEQNPRSGRGGYGWCQWTGPRRRAFESWASKMGFDLDSNAANYGFLKHELTETSEQRVIPLIKKNDTVEQATRTFMKVFERPGVKHLNSRIKYADAALRAFQG